MKEDKSKHALFFFSWKVKKMTFLGMFSVVVRSTGS